MGVLQMEYEKDIIVNMENEGGQKGEERRFKKI